MQTRMGACQMVDMPFECRKKTGLNAFWLLGGKTGGVDLNC